MYLLFMLYYKNPGLDELGLNVPTLDDRFKSIQEIFQNINVAVLKCNLFLKNT